jgi:hypothetical protein
VGGCCDLDDRTRTWQLVMTGHDLHRITPEAQADMARLLDLDPSISHLTVEVGDVSVHVARDWPSDRMEEADRLIDRIAASGVSAIVVHDRNGNHHAVTAVNDRAMPSIRLLLAKPAADRPLL